MQARLIQDGLLGGRLAIGATAGLSAIALSAAGIMPDRSAALFALLSGGIFGTTSVGLAACCAWQRVKAQIARRTLRALIEADGQAAFVATRCGDVTILNSRARELAEKNTKTADQVLSRYFANPAAVVLRLQERAAAIGAATETVITRRGQVRLAVSHLEGTGFLWRIEDGVQLPEDKAGLALPALTAGPSGTILFMNDALRKLVGGRVKTIDRLFGNTALQSGKSYEIQTLDGPVRTTVACAAGQGGRQEVYLLPHIDVPTFQGAKWDAIENLPVPLLKVARTGEVLAANREARNLLQDPIGPDARMSDLLEGLGRPLIDWLADVANDKTANRREFLRGKGEKQDFFVQVALHPAGEGDDRHLIAVLNDMTEFKSLEAQFVQSQKMQAIGQLAGGVAHDFNNLLTAISGHCDLLLLRHDQGDPDYGDLIQIHQNTNRAASLVGQLLAFSRKQNLNPEVLDLRDTLSDLTHLLNRLVGEKVKLVLNHDPALFPIRADKRQLEQVIMNLVVNARDAMPAGGEIRVETENIALAQPVARDRATLQPGRYVLVKVIDEGHGIAPEKIRKIFEPFYTTKRTGEGTGLGLSTAYGIVKQTGGFIFVDSEVGVGTVFSLYFPSYDYPEVIAAPEPVIPGPRRVPVSTKDGVVLLVEDEAPVRAFASRALRLKGFTVIEAESAEKALELLEDPDMAVELFVTDVVMPGKDGPTWVKEALRDRPDTRVVFVSGYAEDAFGENRALIPNSVFLPKPFSLADLTETVQAQLADAIGQAEMA